MIYDGDDVDDSSGLFLLGRLDDLVLVELAVALLELTVELIDLSGVSKEEEWFG